MSTDRQNITHVFIRFRTRRSLSTDTGVLKFKSRHHLDVTAFERQPAPKASLYGLDQPAVLTAEERGLREDETSEVRKNLWLHVRLWASMGACVRWRLSRPPYLMQAQVLLKSKRRQRRMREDRMVAVMGSHAPHKV